MNTKSRITALSLTVAAGLVLAGCSTAAPELTAPAPTESQAPTGEPSSEPTPGVLDSITEAALAAIELAESTAGGVAYELDDEDDRVWKVDVGVSGNDVEVEVNWAGTEVLSTDPDGAMDDDDLRKLESATVTIHEAIRAAASEAEGHVVAVDLESEDGIVVWEVEFEDGDTDWEVYVNASTGEIVKVERD